MKVINQAKSLWHSKVESKRLSDSIGLGGELSITKDLAIYIIANPGMYLEDIKRSEYFLNYSNSTVKRAISLLYTKGYVKFTQDPADKRRNLLYFKSLD